MAPRGRTPPIIALAPTPSSGQAPPGFTTYDMAYGATTLVHVPRAVFTVALALEYHHLGDFYTLEGTLHCCGRGCSRAARWTRSG